MNHKLLIHLETIHRLEVQKQKKIWKRQESLLQQILSYLDLVITNQHYQPSKKL